MGADPGSKWGQSGDAASRISAESIAKTDAGVVCGAWLDAMAPAQPYKASTARTLFRKSAIGGNRRGGSSRFALHGPWTRQRAEQLPGVSNSTELTCVLALWSGSMRARARSPAAGPSRHYSADCQA